MAAKFVQIVDEVDRPIGKATSKEAWEKGLVHRVVRIMIYDKKGRVLLQHRSDNVKTWPNCWTCSASGHVDVGENYGQAAKRELAEELGITDLPLEEVGHGFSDVVWHKYRFKRFAKYYRATLDKVPKHLQKSEVSSVRWFTLAELHAAIGQHPDLFTDGLKETHMRLHQ